MPDLIDSLLHSYIAWVKAYPITSAVIQFALLGTLGEVISKWIIQKSFRYPFSLGLTLWKMLVWAILAVGIKYAFHGYPGFMDILIADKWLPQLSKLGYAFTLSAFMNLQFGLLLVLAHRLLDNIGARKMNWSGLNKSFFSLIWFWIPAHTLTFMQQPDLRIGLAALWSVALGLILGLFNRR